MRPARGVVDATGQRMTESPSGPSLDPPPDVPEPPEGSDPDDDNSKAQGPSLGLAFDLYNVRRRLRTVEAERDGWKGEAMALRARLGIVTPPDRWRKPKQGPRRVWLDDTSEGM